MLSTWAPNISGCFPLQLPQQLCLLPAPQTPCAPSTSAEVTLHSMRTRKHLNCSLSGPGTLLLCPSAQWIPSLAAPLQVVTEPGLRKQEAKRTADGMFTSTLMCFLITNPTLFPWQCAELQQHSAFMAMLCTTKSSCWHTSHRHILPAVTRVASTAHSAPVLLKARKSEPGTWGQSRKKCTGHGQMFLQASSSQKRSLPS